MERLHAVRLSRHLYGAVLPWEFDSVPIRWHEALSLDMEIERELQTSPEVVEE